MPSTFWGIIASHCGCVAVAKGRAVGASLPEDRNGRRIRTSWRAQRDRWRRVRASRRLTLARYWLARGDVDEAARHSAHALRLAGENAANNSAPDRATASLTLVTEATLVAAQLHRECARYAEGEDLLSRLVHVLDAAVPTDERDRLLAHALLQLGQAHLLAGRYDRAGATLTRAMRLVVHAPVREPATLAAVLTSLAIRAKELGAYDRAARLYGIVGRIHHESGATVAAAAALGHNLAGLAHARGHYESAESHARHAVGLQLTAGADDVALAKDIAVLAAGLAGQDRYEEARALLHRAMTSCQDARPPRRYEIAVHLHNLASIEQRCGRAVEAERLYRDALSIKERLLGVDHREVALVANNLATLLMDQERHAEAADLLRRALSIVERRLPPGHPMAGAIRHNLRDLTA